MALYIKDVVGKGSALYKFYLDHPENELLEELMNRQLVAGESEHYNKYKASNICYKELIRNDPNIIYEIALVLEQKAKSYCYNVEKEILTKISIKLNDIGIIEMLSAKQLFVDTVVRGKNPYYNSLKYAYKKHGLELIKCISGLLDVANLLGYAITKRDDVLLDVIFQSSPKEKVISGFSSLLTYRNDDHIKLIIETCITRINPLEFPDKIFHELRHNKPSTIKMILDYGFSITSNEPLSNACDAGNLELIEFYLQYGLIVDSVLLEAVLFKNRHKWKILKLFVRYNIDFSILKIINDNDKNELLTQMEELGLNKNALLCNLVDNNLYI